MSTLSIPQLSPVQDQVIAALAGGATLSDAAAAAGVHRNTISNWRRSSVHFSTALADARYDRAILVRERADQLAGRAIHVIEQILSDTKVAPSIRLKAALAIVNLASTPPEPPRAYASDPEPEKTHNSAQAAPKAHIDTETKPATAVSTIPEKLHNSAQAAPKAVGQKADPTFTEPRPKEVLQA
jgi:hypothetical protein